MALCVQVVEKQNGRADGSVMILVTSGADEHITNCLLTAMSSGSTIHSMALGSSAARSWGYAGDFKPPYGGAGIEIEVHLPM